MITTIIEWIKKLFGKKPLLQPADELNAKFAKEYEDISKTNFTAIFAGSLANKAASDSSVSVMGPDDKPSARSEFIKVGVDKAWKKLKKQTAQALGKGGVIILPYIVNGKPYVDFVDQSRMVISGMTGDDITSVSLLAETVKIDTKQYCRWADYTLENGVHTITTRASDGYGNAADLSVVPQWADITPEISIANVDKLLLGYIKSPIDNRRAKDYYGVPITFGCDDLLRQLAECMEDIDREYNAKKVFVGADDRLFGKGDKLPKNGLFKRFEGSGGMGSDAFWEVFDPAIRDSSYYNRFMQLCALLEKAVGTSKGILTELETGQATATEIRRSQYDTFSLVDDIRSAIEDAVNDVAYAFDVLAEYFGLTPAGARGQYDVSYDWDYSMLESSSETFSQLSELESRKLIRGARLAAWVTGDSLEAAQEEIDFVKENEPKVATLFGE